MIDRRLGDQRTILLEQVAIGLHVGVARNQRLQLGAETIRRPVPHEDALVDTLVDHLHGILRRIIDDMHYRIIEDDHHGCYLRI